MYDIIVILQHNLSASLVGFWGFGAELLGLIESLTEQMRNAAAELQFELAARLRDEIKELKRELRSMDEGGIK